MKVIIEAAQTPSIYKFPNASPVLRIDALRGFTTSDGALIPPSQGQSKDFYLEVPLTVVAEELRIPTFEIDSTQDAYPWDSSVTGDLPGYKATIIISPGKKLPYFPQFKVPTLQVGDPSMTWGEVRIFNRVFRRRFAGLDRYIRVDEVQEWIQNAVGALNKSSPTNTGGVAISYPAVDPAFPEAVGTNDPNWAAIAGTAVGSWELQDDGSGEAVVLDGRVRANSVIVPFSQSETVVGALRCPRGEIVDGVSFVIRSSESGDFGEVGYVIKTL